MVIAGSTKKKRYTTGLLEERYPTDSFKKHPTADLMKKRYTFH